MEHPTHRFRPRSPLQIVGGLAALAALGLVVGLVGGSIGRGAAIGGLVGTVQYLFLGPRLTGTVLANSLRSSDLATSKVQLGRLWSGAAALKAEREGQSVFVPFARKGKVFWRDRDMGALIAALQTNPGNSNVARWVLAITAAETNEARTGLLAQLPKLKVRGAAQ